MEVLAAKTHQPGFKPMLAGLQNPLDIPSLPVLDVDTFMLYDAPDISVKFNMGPTIQYFDGKFFAVWNQGANEGIEHNHLLYATSTDGETWTTEKTLTTPPPDGWMEGAASLWIRHTELWCLYLHGEVGDHVSGGSYYGPNMNLHGKRWNGFGWDPSIVVCEAAMIDKPPLLLPNGKWMAYGRDRSFATQFIIGDIGNWEKIIVPSPEGVLLNEPNATLVGDNSYLTFEFRNENTMTPRTLLRSFSFDNGKTITTPTVTNFPDGQANRVTLKLSDGRYILSSNASNEARRTKLMMSVSDNGLEYDRVYILRGEPTTPKWGLVNDRVGYQYPQVIEKDGYLWFIYSQNKEDILISKVALSSFT